MPTVSRILKITKKDYADEFVNEGGMFLRRISEFPKIENDSQGDQLENLSYILQEQDCLNFKVNGVEQKFSGSFKAWHKDDPFIFCMYAMMQENTPQSNERYYLDNRCSSFGDTIVLVKDGVEFINRIVSYCKKSNTTMKCGLVTYYDPINYSGQLTPFDKKNELSYQQEYRFSFELESTDITEKIFIGNLSDIVEVI